MQMQSPSSARRQQCGLSSMTGFFLSCSKQGQCLGEAIWTTRRPTVPPPRPCPVSNALFVIVNPMDFAVDSTLWRLHLNSCCLSLLPLTQDTQWLLARMTRTIDKLHPDDDEKSDLAKAQPANSAAETLVRQTHAAIYQKFFPQHLVNRTNVQQNPGVGQRKAGSNKRLRSECLQAAVEEWPHLIKLLPSQPNKAARFQRRMIDLERFETSMTGVAEEPCKVFGTWKDWAWADFTGEQTWDPVCEGVGSWAASFVSYVHRYLQECHYTYESPRCVDRDWLQVCYCNS